MSDLPEPVAGFIDLKPWRGYRGLTQDVLAARLGTSKQNVSRYERGERKVPLSLLPALASAPGIATSELLAVPSRQEPQARKAADREAARLQALRIVAKLDDSALVHWLAVGELLPAERPPTR